ncbi:MAG: serine--tRNA ligase [Verrucomicrobiae bacterium]|nr:serine--tRNA ligase [Verrucomicrobiae bacterium]
MLDPKLLRENFSATRTALARRSAEAAAAVDPLQELDARRRALQTQVDNLKNQRNVVSKEVGHLKSKGQDATEKIASMKAVGEQIAALDQQLRELEAELEQKALFVPNTPHSSVPDGADAAANREVRRWGEALKYDFKPKPHWELGPQLKILDFERAAKISGSGFVCHWGLGARLQRALIQFMLDLHSRKHGYTEVSPPFVVLEKAMVGTGQLPKFREDMYALKDDPQFLIPTAEVPLTNLFREEILKLADLPVKMCGYTPCFRREAGSAGKDTRGMIRVHQFDKVELVKIVEQEKSYDELEALVRDAEAVLQALELHYRVVLLCAGDMGFCAAKCYDIEVWCPGVGGYLEVSSCSNFETFQARRMNLRYKDAEGKTRICHTLNGSGTALARLTIALLETHQQADGKVSIPAALRPYLGGLEFLSNS